MSLFLSSFVLNTSFPLSTRCPFSTRLRYTTFQVFLRISKRYLEITAARYLDTSLRNIASSKVFELEYILSLGTKYSV
jgi:hypothetical protein